MRDNNHYQGMDSFSGSLRCSRTPRVRKRGLRKIAERRSAGRLPRSVELRKTLYFTTAKLTKCKYGLDISIPLVLPGPAS